MNTAIRGLPLLLAGSLLAVQHGPAPAQATATAPASQGSTLRAEDLRVATIGYRLATGGAALCPVLAPVSGLLLHHLAEYEQSDRPALIAGGMDRGPGILAVVAGSPADDAGLRAGDIVLAVNGEPSPSPTAIAANRDRKIWRALIEASETAFQEQLARGPVTLTVLRGGETLDLTLTPRLACPLRIRLARSEQKTAVADGDYVVVSSGLVGIVQNEDELAFAIAHEMAHVILHHRDVLREQGVPRRGAARGVGRNGERVRATEREADMLGGRLMLASGYDPARGVLILPRLGATLTLFGLFQTHDDDADRIRAMRALTAG